MSRFVFHLSCLLLSLPIVGAADLQYINRGIATNAQVDAVHFQNEGQFLVRTFILPWDSQNTRTFTNRGVMSGSLGFRLDHVEGGFGLRSAADRVVNTGTIQAFDGGGFSLFLGSGIFLGGSLFADSSYVLMNATEISNRGDIAVGPSGLIQLNGQNIDLSGGTVIVDPIGTSSGFSGFFNGIFLTATNFLPDAGVYDLSWGIDVNTNLNINAILTGIDPTIINSPFFRLTNEFGSCGGTSLTLVDAQTWVYESATSPTNVTVQVVAVQAPPAGVNVNVGFLDFFTFPDSDPPNPGTVTPVVELSTIATNLINLREFTNSIFILDQLASHTNTSLLLNLAVGNTLRPAPIIVSRTFPFRNSLLNANSAIRQGIFNDPLFTNRIVTAVTAAYAALVESTTSRMPALPDVGVTNRPGRVEIHARGELNLRNARIRGEGLVSVKATNFTGSADAVIDSPRFNYNLASTQPLRMQNLAPEIVARFGGPLVTYSALWTNTLVPFDTNQPPIEYQFHLLMVDATGLHTTERAFVHELTLRSPTEVQLNDRISIANQLLLDAPTVTINNRIRLEPGVVWEPARFSSNLTELNLVISPEGFLEASELAQYGRPTLDPAAPAPLTSFINRGTVQAFAHFVDTLDFESTGSIIATNVRTALFTNDCTGQTFDLSTNFVFSAGPSGPIEILARRQARMDAGEIVSDMNVRLSGPVFKLFNNQIRAGGTLFLDVNGTLSDVGDRSQNVWVATNGISMSEPRPVGNLLGTAVNLRGGPFAIVEHVWAAADLGASTNVYSSSNNLAVGVLRLSGVQATDFEFRGPSAGGSYAIYVDLLDISGDFTTDLRAFTNSLGIASNFTVYYAELRTPNPAINTETVNGLRFFGGGRMVWVPFAGPNTSVDVPISSTRSIRVNRALRESLRIDSDQDGIPNGADPTPFGFAGMPAPQVALQAGALEIRFQAAPTTGYTVEYTEQLTAPDWKVLRRLTNSEPFEVEQVVTNFVDHPQRFFRIATP